MIKLNDIALGDGQDLYQPPRRDILRWPIIGRLLRHRQGRLVFQIPLLLIALLIIYDGFTGSPLASQNLATVGVWVHYRGIVILALLLVGNLFCMSCPFTLPRTIALRISRHGRRWPRILRNKWLAIAAFIGFLFLYEWLDMWASPAFTAWVIIGYFLSAFVLEAFFAESPFCKYVCPLGTFNFASSTLSPTQITVNSLDTCRTCPGKECVNGRPEVLGCGTELFPPTLRSNLDCILCLDCARACPYDNVALVVRPYGRELVDSKAWPRRWDLGLLILVFAFTGVSNAFGMVPPFYDLQTWLARTLNISHEGLLLLVIFVLLGLALPVSAGLGAAWLSRRLAGLSEPLRVSFSRFAPAFVPLAFAIWLAHYGFHFATGALAIIPVLQTFLLDHGLAWLGSRANWTLGPLFPGTWILPLQTAIVLGGFAGSLLIGHRIGSRDFSSSSLAVRVLLPWVIVIVGLALAALATFNLPMEMRGMTRTGL
ncbi:MAG: FesM [Chloroflexota bacterium]|jgi:polyferredoxin